MFYTRNMVYVCPMHPEIRRKKPGTCPICGMNLVPENEVRPANHAPHHSPNTAEGWLKTYAPLLTIVGMILLVSIVLSVNQQEDASTSMRYFMAGFFLVFSGFKFLDLSGFAQGYATYDLLARKAKWYGFIYPFLELGLGLSYATNFQPAYTNWFTVVLMAFSGLGVLQSLMAKRKFQCACLGTVIKVPLTQVTLVEDFGMALMALIALFF